MDNQERFDPQEKNVFFADQRAMRAPVAGTVARGFLKEDVEFYSGRNESGAFVAALPVTVTRDLIERGQDRYIIFCAVCHGDAGDGRGIIMTGNYGYVPAPTYHSDNLRSMPDGYFFDVISNGVRTMQGYAPQISVADRWAITAYLRALQRSQYAESSDVPPGERSAAAGDQ
jgi:mono/diheme cytochrome c family protein